MIAQAPRRLPFVAVALLIALVSTSSLALADWPTTCVEANDAFEYTAGRHENVGIYQRAHGRDAEAACQGDHKDDIRYSFAWAFPEAPQPTAPTTERIAPELQTAWTLMVSTELGQRLLVLPNASTVMVGLGADHARIAGQYDRQSHTISINPRLLNERTSVIASILAHELHHAVSDLSLSRPNDPLHNELRGDRFVLCVAEELWSEVVAAGMWLELEGWTPPRGTAVEQYLTDALNFMTADQRDGAQFDYDLDVSDFTRLLVHTIQTHPECTASQ